MRLVQTLHQAPHQLLSHVLNQALRQVLSLVLSETLSQTPTTIERPATFQEAAGGRRLTEIWMAASWKVAHAFR